MDDRNKLWSQRLSISRVKGKRQTPAPENQIKTNKKVEKEASEESWRAVCVTLFDRDWKKAERVMWIFPSAPRCGSFDSVIISRRHNTDPAAASVWERGKLEHWLDFPTPAPADATDVRGGQSSGRPCRRVLWRPASVFYHQLTFIYACVCYELIY